MPNEFYTIGHGTKPIAGFLELLSETAVNLVVDVRTAPRSRTNPQFDRATLANSLAAFTVEYRHIAELGGLRPRQKEIPASTNAFWENQSFHNYADYATSREFQSALKHLRELGRAKRCAIMCAETLWWRCHRRIVADYLLTAGEDVRHIIEHGKTEPASLTPGAVPRSDGTILYPAAQGELL